MPSAEHKINLLTSFSLSFLVCTCAILFLSWFALRFGVLLDTPDERKRHTGRIPLVGGLAVFVSLTVALFVNDTFSLFAPLYLAALWLVLLGLIDDVVQLSSRFRLMAQLCAALIVVFYGDMRIESVGRLIGEHDALLGSYSIVFTVLCTLGVINAINMIDGMDGLSGGIAVTTLIALLIVGMGAAQPGILTLIIAMLGSLIAFLLFNVGYFDVKRKVFLGDAGSTFVGLTLAFLFVSLSQTGSQPLSPVVAGWLFGLPLIDSIAVMVGRLYKRQSPFRADRGHMHHRLLDLGLSSKTALATMLGIHLLVVSIGLYANGLQNAEPFLFWAFIAIVVAHFFVFEIASLNKFRFTRRAR